jgi:hypothetical protein
VFKLIINVFNLFVKLFVFMFLWNVSLFPCQVVNAYYLVFFCIAFCCKSIWFFFTLLQDCNLARARFLILLVKYLLLLSFNYNMYSVF